MPGETKAGRPRAARSSARKPRAKAAKPPEKETAKSLEERVADTLAALEAKRTRRDFDNLARFGITASGALGVSMANIQALAKRLGPSHVLALALWKTGIYEARLLCAFVDEPERVTPAQMERWCRDFDNWGICDTLCFKLWDRTPHAWAKVEEWAVRDQEFVRRTAFALLASLALHDKETGDDRFVHGLALVERAASDDRNFVKKGVSWALRSIGRRNVRLRARSVALSKRLADSPSPAARWVGRDALRDLGKAVAK